MEVARQLRQSCYYQQAALIWIFLVCNSIIINIESQPFGLSFLDPKDLCLPNQFSKAFCQYILNLMSKKKLGSFNDWINTYFQSFICLPPHDMNIFWPASFSKSCWRFWTEHSCYGWEWHFLARNHYAKLKNIHNSAKTYDILLK